MAEEAGVEPTRRVAARLTGFEDQVPHRGYRSSVVTDIVFAPAALILLHQSRCISRAAFGSAINRKFPLLFV